jgi:superfamily I DNA and/or RNA helicase
VGTAHRFQGREFDVVIFDLTEDGGFGWVSQGW